ncbi:MAG: hypothetical protein ACI9K2_003974 [Myxococcota bacterium]|jgi:hypothetical protein
MPTSEEWSTETLDPYATTSFPTQVWDWGPELCEIGSGTFRATYWVDPADCAEPGCADDLLTNEFSVYCEG